MTWLEKRAREAFYRDSIRAKMATLGQNSPYPRQYPGPVNGLMETLIGRAKPSNTVKITTETKNTILCKTRRGK
jgi:hypothetical protein